MINILGIVVHVMSWRPRFMTVARVSIRCSFGGLAPGRRSLKSFGPKLMNNAYPGAKRDEPLLCPESLPEEEMPDEFWGIRPDSHKIQNGRPCEIRHFPMDMFNLMESRTKFLQLQDPEFLPDRNCVTINTDGLVDPESMDVMEGLGMPNKLEISVSRC